MDSGLLADEQASAPTARVIWTGEHPPPSAVNVGNVPITGLPDEAEQRAGFELPASDAALLCACFADYKSHVVRGGE